MARRKRWARSWKSKARPTYAWERPGAKSLGGQAASADGLTLLSLSSPLYPDFGGVALDFSNKKVLVIVRLICKIILLVTGAGAAQSVQVHVGIRLDEPDSDGSLRSASDQPSVLAVTDDNRREDWLYRTSSFHRVGATDVDVPVTWENGQNHLTLDFKPNRKYEQRKALVLHTRAVLVGTSTNTDAIVAGVCDPQILYSMPR